jgi:hypothetical protein
MNNPALYLKEQRKIKRLAKAPQVAFAEVFLMCDGKHGQPHPMVTQPVAQLCTRTV